MSSCFSFNMSKCQIDFGEGYNDTTPLYQHKTISFLFGAGFSAPMGYPIGNDLNEKLLNFDDKAIVFAPSGELAISADGQKSQFQMHGVRNFHQKRFEFCQRLIKEYYVAHGIMGTVILVISRGQ